MPARNALHNKRMTVFLWFRKITDIVIAHELEYDFLVWDALDRLLAANELLEWNKLHQAQ